MQFNVQELQADVEEGQAEHHSQLHISCERQLSAASGLQLTTALSPNTSQQPGSLQELCLSIYTKHATALHRARLDIETNCSSASRASFEGSLQLGSSCLASATLGMDLSSSWLAQNMLKVHTHTADGAAGASIGAAMARTSSSKRRKVEAKWLAAEGLGQQLVLQAVQQLSWQHLLQLSASSIRDSSSSSGSSSSGSSSSGCPYGSTWLECSISAASTPAEAIRLAAGSRGNSRGDSAHEKQSSSATTSTKTQSDQKQQNQQQQQRWHTLHLHWQPESKDQLCMETMQLHNWQQQQQQQEEKHVQVQDHSSIRQGPALAWWQPLQQLPVWRHLLPHMHQRQQQQHLAGKHTSGASPSTRLASKLQQLQASSNASETPPDAIPVHMRPVSRATAAASAVAAAAGAAVPKGTAAAGAAVPKGTAAAGAAVFKGTVLCSLNNSQHEDSGKQHSSSRTAGVGAEQGQLAAAGFRWTLSCSVDPWLPHSSWCVRLTVHNGTCV